MKKYEFINKALYFNEEKILVIGDLHVGYEEYLNKKGIMVPRTQFKRMMEDLKEVFASTGRVNQIIILGDLKHEFGTITQQEWDETLLVLDYLLTLTQKIILVKGNHDSVLGPIADKRGIEVVDSYVFQDFLFLHGDKELEEIYKKEIKTIVLGHRHPAVIIGDEYKKEKYKAFLVGKFKGKKFIILPSFFPFVEGSDIIGSEEYLFIPRKELEKAEAYVVGDKVYKFGRVKDII